MKQLLSVFLSLFGKAGIKALINSIASSDLFKDFIKGVLLKRVEGLKVNYPQTYTLFEQYTNAVSEIPAILTDEDPKNVEQIAAALLEFQNTLKKLSAKTADVSVSARSFKINI